MPHREPPGQARITRIVAYLLTIAAGAILPSQLGILPPDSMRWLWLVMCCWLVLGGVLSGASQLMRRWTGEFVGLPLLASAMVGFGLLQGGVVAWHPSVLPSVALLWAFGLMFFARWRDVVLLYRAARKAGRP